MLFQRNKIAKNIGLELFQAKNTSDVIFSALKNARDDVIAKRSVRKPEALFELSNFLNKDLDSWLTYSSKNLFTFRDYAKSWYTTQEIFADADARAKAPTEEYTNVMTYDVCTLICYAYYRYNELYLEKPFEDMMRNSTPPDYTRPHGWATEHYYSIGEVLTALSDNNAYSVNIIESFGKQFWTVHKMEDVSITYERYSAAWDDAHSVSQIKPWSIEHCVYYVQQQNLPIKYIFAEKAPEKRLKSELGPSFKFYLCPNFKYFDVWSLMRFLCVWDFWIEIFNDVKYINIWRPNDFIVHCSEKYFFHEGTKSPGLNISNGSFCWSGIEPKDDCDSFQDLFEHWVSSIKFFRNRKLVFP